MARREVVSYCRICTAMCGIVVTVDGEQIVQVRGDAEHPLSRGYLCPKGRALGAFHHHPRRLNAPRRRNPDGTWSTPAMARRHRGGRVNRAGIDRRSRARRRSHVPGKWYSF